MSVEGYITADIVEGAYDTELFEVVVRNALVSSRSLALGTCFITHTARMKLPICNPFPVPRTVLVVDNCNIHKGEGLLLMLQERGKYLDPVAIALSCRRSCPTPCASGVRIEYLTPYSPDLNPIEESFACLKAFIRRQPD